MKSRNSLEKIHSAFKTPNDQIFAIIKKAVGQQALKSTPLHAGYDSEVYRVDTRNNAFVLKINHQQSVPYASEAWAMEQAQKVGVPVADVYYCDTFDFPDAQREVIVQSLVTGVKFESMRATITQQDFEKGLRNMGEILARLHSITVDGCYHRHSDGSWDFTTLGRCN
jgi:Ser/Thr protein kinase RdoA (MazF antagonist)